MLRFDRVFPRRAALGMLLGAASTAAVGVVLVIAAPTSDGWSAQPAMQQLAMRRRVAAADPPLGAVMPLPQTGSPHRAGPSQPSADTLVLFVGGDGPCCSDSVAQWRANAQKALPGASFLVVAPSLRQGRERNGDVVADPGGRLARAYNAGWAPRADLVGGDGRLIWREPADATDLNSAAAAAASARRLRLQ